MDRFLDWRGHIFQSYLHALKFAIRRHTQVRGLAVAFHFDRIGNLTLFEHAVNIAHLPAANIGLDHPPNRWRRFPQAHLGANQLAVQRYRERTLGAISLGHFHFVVDVLVLELFRDTFQLALADLSLDCSLHYRRRFLQTHLDTQQLTISTHYELALLSTFCDIHR